MRVGNESYLTLQAIEQFRHLLHNAEKDLIRSSKKLRTKEIAQSAKFATNGIQEAVHYLEIVKNVIRKTDRLLQRKTRSAMEAAEESSPAGSEPVKG